MSKVWFLLGLSPWLSDDRWTVYPESEITPSHGTFVAGVALYGDACDLLGVLGYKAVQDKYLEGIVRFPNYQIGLHNIALFITLFESNHTHEYREFINIYEKAIHAIPTDEEEIEKQELIKENFENEYLDFQKLMKG